MEEKKRMRSPNYPYISLERAVTLAENLFDSNKRYSVPLAAAAKSWEMSPTSSSIPRFIAALLSYGLLDSEGEKQDKRVKISDLAFKIIIDKRPNSLERKRALIEAAMVPIIFQKLTAHFPDGLPGDETLKYTLIADFKFNPESAGDVIKVFRETIDYTQFYESGIISEERTGSAEASMVNGGVNDMSTKVSNPVERSVSTQRFGLHSDLPKPGTLGIGIDSSLEREVAKYPVGKDTSIRLIATGKITQKAIKKLIAILELNLEDFPNDEHSIPLTGNEGLNIESL